MAWEFMGRTIHKIGVVGSGNIGPDIALYFTKVFHKFGVPVVMVDISEKALKSGEARVKGKFSRGVRSGAFTKEEVDAMLANLTWTTDYAQFEETDFVMEAATEDVGIKRKIFAELEKFCPETAILASNSSHMEPEVIFDEITNKERCLVIHYFFPAERSIIVEIVPGNDTAPEITDFLLNFYEQIGKAPIKVKSRFGYAIDPIFEGIFLAGALLVEKGIATVEQMDAMIQRILGLGVGPFTAMNLTGGNPITQHGVSEMNTKIMPWFHSPAILNNQVALDRPWKTSWRHEDVHYNESVYERVADSIKGVYFGLVCEILDSGIAILGDLEMAVESSLVIKAPFQMMNDMGVDKALELVKAYAEEWPGFKHEIARMKSPKELEVFALNGHSVLNLIENLGKPVVCAMNGLAFGGGNELAMACTARIAKKGTKVLCGQPEPKLGLVPGYGGSQRLPRIIGLSAAWPILRTGNPISSEKALELGLIQEEVEGDIKEAGITFAEKLISGEISTPVIQKGPLEIPDTLPEVDIGFLSKKTDEIMQRVILEGAKMTLEEGLKHEAKVLGELVETKDMRIGMETFRKFGPKKNAGFSNA